MVKPVAWTTAFFLPTKAARRFSRVSCKVRLPHRNRDPPGPLPQPTRSLAPCFHHSGIVSKSQVVVGPNHNQTPARHLHFRAPRSVYGAEVRIKPLFPGVLDHKSKRLAAISKCHKRYSTPSPSGRFTPFYCYLEKMSMGFVLIKADKLPHPVHWHQCILPQLIQFLTKKSLFSDISANMMNYNIFLLVWVLKKIAGGLKFRLRPRREVKFTAQFGGDPGPGPGSPGFSPGARGIPSVLRSILTY